MWRTFARASSIVNTVPPTSITGYESVCAFCKPDLEAFYRNANVARVSFDDELSLHPINDKANNVNNTDLNTVNIQNSLFK